ncbi:MAG: PAS domain S-box protein, partial [Rhodospirillaceae bacterium]|nr:PAS domain S-box protein [Rhodospirillaceae bacterium]
MTPLAVVLRIVAIIFIAEALVMFGLWLAPAVSNAIIEALIDAAALALLSTPPIYFLVIRPYILARDKAEKSLSNRESHLRSVMENVTEGIITIDEAGIITSANHYTERLFGYRHDELIGQPVHMLMTGEDRNNHDGYVRSYLETGKGKIINVGAREVTGLHKDGSEIHIDLNIGDVILHGERMFIGILHDLTQRKSMENRLRHSQKIEALGKLTGGITHEFNNLLMVIQGSLERLGDNSSQTDKISQQFLTMALDGVQRGKGLTGKLLAYSRDQVLRPDALNPQHILPQMGDVIQQMLGETFTFDTTIADDIWDLYVDGNELEAAILNLSVNARDVMPAGGNITLIATNIHVAEDNYKNHPGLKQGDYVQIALADTGRGMSPEVIERAFDPFFTTKDTGKGTGLGLSMVYGFAKQSGGYVAIDSELGTGTTITIYLPKSKLAADPTAPEISFTTTNAFLGKEENILV